MLQLNYSIITIIKKIYNVFINKTFTFKKFFLTKKKIEEKKDVLLLNSKRQ